MADFVFRPYTWADVADRLAEIRNSVDVNFPPDGLVRVDVFWSGMSLVLTREDVESSAIDWLERIFGSRLDRERREILLEGPAFSSALPFSIEIFDADVEELPSKWAPRIASDNNIWFKTAAQNELPPNTPREVAVLAFHSVKGGVGRTTAAVAMARVLAQRSGKPILLVDADFEAPGLSYFLASKRPEISISFEDLLALAHADPDTEAEATSEFVARQLENHRLGDVYLLPCSRNLERLAAFNIRPEHLSASRPDHPSFVVSLLQSIARRLDAAAVVVDLRAGFTDLAALVMLAPNVRRVFVTSASGQSWRATGQMLRFIGRELKAQSSVEGYPPAIVINQVLPEIARSDEFRAARDKLLDLATAEFVDNRVVIASPDEPTPILATDLNPLSCAVIEFQQSLVGLPSEWDAFVRDIDSVNFPELLVSGLEEWIEGALPLNPTQEAESAHTLIDFQTKRTALAEHARAAAFSETNTLAHVRLEPLVIAPLRNLAEDFTSQLPIAISIGAKGTGKTFTFSRLVQHEDWGNFVRWAAPHLSSTHRGHILPIFSAKHVLPAVAERQKTVSELIGYGRDPMSVFDIQAAFQTFAQVEHTDSEWVGFWLDAVAWAAGFLPGESGAGPQFLKDLRARGTGIVAMVEGLEELFQDVRSRAGQRAAIRALLTDLPARLKAEPGRPLGLLAFVRQDLYDAAVTQNREHIREIYRRYELTWNEHDVLELVAWLVHGAGVIENFWSSSWRAQSSDDQRRRLFSVWGEKLGTSQSKEARSQEWIIAVLSDLKGRLTARDLIVFIAQAAKGSASSGDYPDRLLTPRAMRDAVEPTSKSKIDALAQETPDLAPTFDQIRSYTSRREVQVPFAEDVIRDIGLDTNMVKLLQEHGVLFGEKQYEIPELFRMGLGFTRKGARANIIGLMRRARERAARTL